MILNQNTAFGSQPLYHNSSGTGNSAFGLAALFYNQTGSNNTAIGWAAGQGANSYSYSNNTLVGYKSGFALRAGSNNLLFGYQSGDSITTGSNNIIIGYDIDATTTTANNQLNIGNILFGTMLDGTGTTLASGNIGIGTNTPLAKLAVQADASTDELLRVANSSGQNLFQVNSLGYAGIGASTSPAYRLHVASSDANYLGYFYNSSTATSAGGLYVRSDGEGNLLTLNGNGTDVLTVSPSQATFNVPVSFQSAGDVSMAYDLYMSNESSGNIRFLGPGYITTDSSYQNLDLTLRAANLGRVIADDNFIVTGNFGIGTDTPGAMLAIQSPSATNTPIINIASSTGSSLLFMGADGNIGIGTANPLFQLSVIGQGYIGSQDDGFRFTSVNGLATITGINHVAGAYNDIEIRTGASGSGIYFVNFRKRRYWNYQSNRKARCLRKRNIIRIQPLP